MGYVNNFLLKERAVKTAILTGFQPFGAYPANPTKELALSLDGKILVGHRIRSFVFPTLVLSPEGEEDWGRKLVDEALALDASVIISLGLASESQGLRVEKFAANWVENDKYCTAFENRKPVQADRPAHEKLQMPLAHWDLVKLHFELLGTNTPLQMSEDAGGYCCNALMYRTLRVMQDFGVDIPFVFAHVPCTRELVVHMPDFDRMGKAIIQQKDIHRAVWKLLLSHR